MSLKKLFWGLAGFCAIAAMLFFLSQKEITESPNNNQTGDKDIEMPVHAYQYSISLLR